MPAQSLLFNSPSSGRGRQVNSSCGQSGLCVTWLAWCSAQEIGGAHFGCLRVSPGCMALWYMTGPPSLFLWLWFPAHLLMAAALVHQAHLPQCFWLGLRGAWTKYNHIWAELHLLPLSCEFQVLCPAMENLSPIPSAGKREGSWVLVRRSRLWAVEGSQCYQLVKGNAMGKPGPFFSVVTEFHL